MLNLLSDLYRAAQEHAHRTAADVSLSSTREEHIRVTARANEAAHLAAQLQLVLATVAAQGDDGR